MRIEFGYISRMLVHPPSYHQVPAIFKCFGIPTPSRQLSSSSCILRYTLGRGVFSKSIHCIETLRQGWIEVLIATRETTKRFRSQDKLLPRNALGPIALVGGKASRVDHSLKSPLPASQDSAGSSMINLVPFGLLSSTLMEPL